MPELQAHDTHHPPETSTSVSLVHYSAKSQGWSVLIVNEAGVESVAITWKKPARLRRDRQYGPGDYFVLPNELAGSVLAVARDLEAKRQAVIEEGYAAQAADLEAEAEALEWCEALIGDGFDSDSEAW